MFEHKRLQSLDDYFLELCNRKEKGVFFTELMDMIRIYMTLSENIMNRQGVPE